MKHDNDEGLEPLGDETYTHTGHYGDGASLKKAYREHMAKELDLEYGLDPAPIEALFTAPPPVLDDASDHAPYDEQPMLFGDIEALAESYRVNHPVPETIPRMSPRADALDEAKSLITGDRNAQYGPPTQDFQRTADLLNALGYRRFDVQQRVYHDLKSSDVALIMAELKISRIIQSRGKRDSWVDLAGYAACGYECTTEEN